MGAVIREIRTGRHCVFALHAHLVFVTKYHQNVFRSDHLEALERVLRSVCSDFEAELREFNGEADHVHLLVTYPPKVALATLVNSLKGVSSRLLRRDFPDIERRYWRGHLWSASYFAGSVGGAPLDVLGRYIEQQRRPSGPRGAWVPIGSSGDPMGTLHHRPEGRRTAPHSR